MTKRNGVVLVAEDDENNVLFFQRACSAENVDAFVRFVGDGQQVIDYLQGKPPYDDRQKFPFPELLILDLKMPRVNGFDVLKWLQHNPEHQQLPVIVMSNSVLPQDQARVLALGAREYHVKTFTTQQTRELVRRIWSKWVGHTFPAEEIPPSTHGKSSVRAGQAA